MKIKLSLITTIMLISTVVVKSQSILPRTFLTLYNYANQDNAVNLIDDELTQRSTGWKFLGGDKKIDHFILKWHHDPLTYWLGGSDFYLLTTKTKSNSLLNTIIYSFSNQELFTSYIKSINSLDGAKIMSDERKADRSSLLVYEIKGITFKLSSHPTKDPTLNGNKIYRTYAVEMHYTN